MIRAEGQGQNITINTTIRATIHKCILEIGYPKGMTIRFQKVYLAHEVKQRMNFHYWPYLHELYVTWPKTDL